MEISSYSNRTISELAKSDAVVSQNTEETQLQTSQSDATSITPNTTDTSNTTDNFSSFILKALGRSDQEMASEEELFSVIIGQRLSATNQEAADYYNAQKSELTIAMRDASGYVSYEDVANQALKNTVEAGHLTKEEAEKLKGEAFSSAQLDDNLTALYDDRGSAEDPTIAVAKLQEALMRINETLTKIDSGELTTESISLDAGSTGATSASGGSSATGAQSAMDGSGGFLWKPVSDSDGNLVVLLPTDLKGMIDRVEVHSELPPTESTKLDEGRFAGDTHNGGRPHFRFSKPGEDYGENVHVVVFKDDGTTVTWDIEDPSQRYD